VPRSARLDRPADRPPRIRRELQRHSISYAEELRPDAVTR
jgi:hypothetical protein